MTPLPTASASLFGFIKKAALAHNSAFLVLSAPGSITVTAIFDALLDGIPLKEIFLPALVGASVIFIYFPIFCIDFCFGLYAAKKIAGPGKEYFESSKGWSSIFKMFSIIFVISGLSLLSVITAIAKFPYFPTGLIIAAGVVGIMAAAFDFASVGENYKKINGKQARIFIWMNKMTNIIDEELTSRLKGFFQAFRKPTPKP